MMEFEKSSYEKNLNKEQNLCQGFREKKNTIKNLNSEDIELYGH